MTITYTITSINLAGNGVDVAYFVHQVEANKDANRTLLLPYIQFVDVEGPEYGQFTTVEQVIDYTSAVINAAVVADAQAWAAHFYPPPPPYSGPYGDLINVEQTA